MDDITKDTPNSSRPPAPHIRRLAAAMIDGMIIGIITVGIRGSLTGTLSQKDPTSNQAIIASLISFILSAFYYAGFWVKRNGQTPGKQLMHLRVIKENEEPIDWFTGIIRYLGQIVSSIVLGLGYVWILFDARRQGWHDKFAKTLVVESDDKKPNGCFTFFGCFLPLLFFIIMVGVGVYMGFTEATAKREKNQSVSSYTKALTDMKPEAKIHYDKSQELFKQMREAGTDAQKTKKLNDENIAELKKATELDPTNPRIWAELGAAYTWVSTTGTLEDGLRAYAKAEDLDPNNSVYIVNTADMLWRLGKFDDAILEVQKGLRINDNYAYGHLILARAYAGNKIYTSAQSEYDKAIEIYKNANDKGQFDDDILQAQKEQAILPKN